MRHKNGHDINVIMQPVTRQAYVLSFLIKILVTAYCTIFLVITSQQTLRIFNHWSYSWLKASTKLKKVKPASLEGMKAEVEEFASILDESAVRNMCCKSGGRTSVFIAAESYQFEHFLVNKLCSVCDRSQLSKEPFHIASTFAKLDLWHCELVRLYRNAP